MVPILWTGTCTPLFVTTGMVDRGFFGRSDGLRNADLRSFGGRHGSSLLSFPGAARSHMGAPGLSRGRFLSLEGWGVVPGGFRSGVRWIQETGQVVNDRLDEVLEKPNEWDREVRARRAGSDRSAV